MIHRVHIFLLLLLIVSASSISVAQDSGSVSLRTWSDSTGEFSVKATFVSNENGVVTLKNADGSLFSVPFGRLSQQDQSYIQQVASKPQTSPFSLAIPNASGGTSTPSTPATNSDASNLKKVMAEGMGMTADEALKDAFRNAVRQVVGAVIDANTLIENDEIVEDKILTYSGGFINKYTEVPGSKKV